MPDISDRQSNVIVLIHDAFKGLNYWNDSMTGGDAAWPGVAMGVHIYQMFSDGEVACSQGSALSSFHLYAIVGEWTSAPTYCVKYLNGRGRGARYDGSFDGPELVGVCAAKTGSGATFSPDYKTFLRKYWEAQKVVEKRKFGRGPFISALQDPVTASREYVIQLRLAPCAFDQCHHRPAPPSQPKHKKSVSSPVFSRGRWATIYAAPPE